MEALNENDRLLKRIVFLFDKDLISDVKNFDFGATKNMANIVNWLATQIEILICRNCLQITEKKPGAIASDEDHPTVIYSTML